MAKHLMKKTKNNRQIFYAVLAAVVITGLGFYLIWLPEVGLSSNIPSKSVRCSEEIKESVYNHYLKAYEACLIDFDVSKEGACKLLNECNEENPYNCAEKCAFERNIVNGLKPFCESIRQKLIDLIKECYKEGERPLPEELPECIDSCGNSQN